MKHLIFPLRASLYRPLGSLLSHTSRGICKDAEQSEWQGGKISSAIAQQQKAM